ncbi:SDR family NAD(P)-dependent oxidoreductase [Methylibium sp.]|uniref:SDR family NAD(P)-dependent oxidoreductase n=1 Tax=Methylibium sp. TaxID=2067992 RepID=UPI00345BB317
MALLPLLSLYTASKAAVNAFTESLAVELAQFGVRVRLVLSGRAQGTRFVQNASRSWRAACRRHTAMSPTHLRPAWRQRNAEHACGRCC